jgi:TctA family transporter
MAAAWVPRNWRPDGIGAGCHPGLGVPGTVGSAATILDGHPMAKNGEASRAFGAAFTSSVLGGVFGACLLAVSIPILQPLMLAMGTP